MGNPTGQEHTLATTRIGATIGLIALGGGLGVGLMLAKTLIVTGFLISLVCSLGVIWLYADHFRSAYRAVTGKAPYSGPPARELLIAVGMVIVLVTVSCSVFSAALVEEPTINKAQLEIATISQFKVPASATVGGIGLQLHNAGKLDATNVVLAVKGRFLDALMSKEEINLELEAMDRAVANADKKQLSSSTVTPTQNPLITLQDIAPDRWAHLAEGVEFPVITITDAQWNEFLEGKHYIYVLLKARYGDESLHDKAYWHATFCGFYVGTTAFWHNCAANNIDKVIGRR
jgi:hypothetical protein